MHYYKHHIGDYAAATAHLSILEDGAYSRLLRVYYRDEKPLPADAKAVQRLVGARSREEREAVEVVLGEFFTLTDEGWRNKRADDEIEAFQEAEGESQDKKKHEKERKRRYRQRRAELFEALRERGIVPSFDTSLPDLEAMLSRGTRRGQDADADGDGTATHKPDSRLQTTEKQVSEPKRSPKGSRLSTDWQPSAELSAWAAAERPDVDLQSETSRFRDYWAAKPGKDGVKLDWDATFRNWIRNARQGPVKPGRNSSSPEMPTLELT